jgi:hypothetical protein
MAHLSEGGKSLAPRGSHGFDSPAPGERKGELHGANAATGKWRPVRSEAGQRSVNGVNSPARRRIVEGRKWWECADLARIGLHRRFDHSK